MTFTPVKVGELARRTGLSVRTLHHYDHVGLLCPSEHTPAGHRLYTAADAARLQQIVSLRGLGFGLEQIRECLESPEFSPERVMRLHAARLREQIEQLGQLRDRLDAVAERLASAETVSAEEFFQTIEATTMFEKYYTPEQLRQLDARRGEVGKERIREVEAEWPRLMAEVQAEMDAGTDPADPRVQQLAERWSALVREFTGGDAGIERSLGEMYRNETTVHGMNVEPMRAMGEYIGRAPAARRER